MYTVIQITLLSCLIFIAFARFHIPEKKKKGKQHTGVLWIYLELNEHRITSDSPYPNIASITTLKTFERDVMNVSHRIETQYIDVIFRQVMEIC